MSDNTNNNMTSGGNAAFHNYLNDFAHISDPLERRRLALEKIDNASFSWAHVRTIMVAGVGFMTDAYDIFAINMGMTALTYVFWKNDIPSSTATLIKVSTSVGTVVGQFGFGIMADTFGRKAIYGSELIIMITSCLMQVIIGDSYAVSFCPLFVFFRIIMGIGIGGDYPLSSVITSEFATTKWRGAIMGAVFANQGWGQLLAGIVSIIAIAGYKNALIGANSYEECDRHCLRALDIIWRIIIGFGCVPACLALYYRLTIPESPRYTIMNEDISAGVADANHFLEGKYGSANPEEVDELRDTEQQKKSDESEITEDGAPQKASAKDFCKHFAQWKHMKIIIGTAGSWFMLDVAYYGLGLNTAIILQAIGFASSKNIYRSLYNTAAGNLILICAGSIPGYWFTVATVDTIGRKPIQVGGFIILTVLFCAIGFGYHKLTSHGLLGLYIIAQFFQNFGPNATTFIVPGECFPTKYRSTAHGMSAASGKIGAIIAQTCLGTLVNHGCAADNKNCYLPHVMEIFALFMLLGIFTSLLLPETKRKTLEQLAEQLHGEIDPSSLAARNKSPEESV